MSVVNVSVKSLRPQYENLKTWLEDPNHVYIGRHLPYVEGANKSKWANPFSVKKYGRDNCLEMYEAYIRKYTDLWNDLGELNNKILGCWCYPQGCHGDILIKLLEEKNKIG